MSERTSGHDGEANVPGREPAVARAYRRLVRLYPRSLRSAHEDEMVEVVRRRWQRVAARAWPRRLVFVVAALGAAVGQGILAWLEVAGRTVQFRPRPYLSELPREARLAARALRRAPGFTVTAVLVLALGIGANVAIFTLIESVLLAPLPYPEPDRLVAVQGQPWTPTEITLELRRTSRSLEIAGYYPQPLIVTSAERPLELEGAAVTPDFFDLFGATVARGRGFTVADTLPGAPRVAIVSDHTREQLFGQTAGALGRTVAIDGRPHEIVGVLEPGFRLRAEHPADPRLWIPLQLRPSAADGEFNYEIPIGRLLTGATLQQAQAELDGVMSAFRERHPDLAGSARWNLRLAAIKETVVGDVRGPLLMLQAAVVAVLLLACANVANLMLVRTGARQQELAVRAALGASAGRLLRLLAGEAILLALLAGSAGFLLTHVGRGVLLALAPADMPRLTEVTLGAPVVVFTLLLAAGSALVFGSVPAFMISRARSREALEGGGRGATGSRALHRTSQALAALEVCLTLILLVAAGLLGRSFFALAGQELGFRTTDIAALSLRLSESNYDTIELLDDFLQRAQRRVAQVPGVEAVAVSNYLPTTMGATREIRVDGPGGPQVAQVQYAVIGADYFRLLDLPLLRGRGFDQRDRRDAPRVAVIDEAMARALWPDRDPLNERFRMGEDGSWITVVGLVGAVRGRGPAQQPRPGFYVPFLQRPDTPTELAVGRNAVILARSRRATDSDLAGAFRSAIRRVDPGQPVTEVATLEDAVALQVAPQRFRAVLLGVFAVVALLTAVAGIYGVVSYMVGERTRELGIRLALGATPRETVASVLRWGLRLVATGIGLSLLGIVVLTRLLSSLLFDVSPTDPATIVAAIAVVLVTTMGACLLPALRATRADPALALRGSGKAGRLYGTLCLIAAPLLLGCLVQAPPAAQGTLVGGPCEGCEAVFELGDRELAPVTTLPDWERDGPRLELRGTIYEADGTTPAAGVILYVHHTNQQGVYETHGDESGWARRHGILRGWVRTDETGRYVIRTLVPGTYPSRSEPAHVHGTILEPDGRYYWIDSWHFRGDPLLDEAATDPEVARGGSGVVELHRQGDTRVAERDIVLGKNVPGYGPVASGAPGPPSAAVDQAPSGR